MPASLRAGLVILLAIALDLALGDPPNPLHPVAWIGGLLGRGRRWLCRGGSTALLVNGAALTLTVTALTAGAGIAVAGLASALGPGGLVLEAVALKSTVSVYGLVAAARSVASALERGDLDAARARLGFHLVSRPTATLDAGQVASGAIESIAENLTDALVAPLLFFVLLGLPGALAYRTLNTADTMLGYREGALEYFGKVAAHLDDVANLLPARLAALALVSAAGRAAPAAWSVMMRDRVRTASPNAGWTMSAMAGALGVTLAKPGAYRLGAGRTPMPADIARGIRLLRRATAVSILVLLTVEIAVRIVT
jgi:adenosylcobinamide-phosphate synthase